MTKNAASGGSMKLFLKLLLRKKKLMCYLITQQPLEAREKIRVDLESFFWKNHDIRLTKYKMSLQF
jgi:hypothetical protein